MGSNAIYGSDGAQGYTPHLGIVTCFKNSEDWLLMGQLYSPQIGFVNLGLTTYTYHPEAVTWAVAEATCQSQALQIQARRTGSMPSGGPHAVGHLASTASNEDFEILLSIMAKQPPVFTSPGSGVNPDFYGEDRGK